MKVILICLVAWALALSGHAQRRVVYHLYITDTTVNYTGKKVRAIAINGTIPGPVLYFTEGDTAEIHIHNEMMMETSVHWHGLIVPNKVDGVSWLTTPP
ncbi:MAG TPA: multicopper oxidase domain-containing protein, partial [Puia sp.]|nr:multicopper oxidase domain-containing protein [Puia sp.]